MKTSLRARRRLPVGSLALALVVSGLAATPASAARAPQITAVQRVLPATDIALMASAPRSAAAAAAAAPAVPQYDHVVVVIMENHSSASIIANPAAPYINALAAGGASMTQSYGVTHPSQPNYLALFSGSQQGVADDSCLGTFPSDNLGAQLIAAGKTFIGYSESMPSVGYTGCATSGGYARKHNPWVDFSNVPVASNQPLTSLPTDWSGLPTVAMVVPNLQNDMHDGTITQADTWLQDKFDGYLQWATTHNSLLVVTWDEDDYHASNRIPTIFAGAGVRTGQYPERISHYNVLRTLQDMYGLSPLASSATAGAIVDIWSSSPVNQPPVAAFTGSCLQLVCTVDASTSTDPDGTVAGYAWDWGDGATTSGVTASHTFATGGAKTVTLMVTDNLGQTGTASRTLSATGQPPGQPFAADAFARTRTTGWGSADVGGAWTVASTANSSVGGGAGNLVVGLGQGNTATLPAVSSSDSDITVTFAVDKVATGNGTYVKVIGRHVAANQEYQAQLRTRPDGGVLLSLLVLTPAGSTVVEGESLVPGTTIIGATPVKLRLQVTGVSPTTLRVKAWQASATEPAAWQLSTSDSAAGLQASGSIVLYTYLSGASTVTPVTVRFSSFSAVQTNQPPLAAFTGSCTVLDCSVTSASTDSDGNVNSSSWNWGDGTTTTGTISTHSYANAGSYNVTLTVTDDRGAPATASHVLTATAPPNLPPSAAFSAACTDLACTADSSSSSDPDGTIAGYSWNWGDGALTNGAAGSHSYAAAGTYPVVLTVADDAGATGSVSHQVTVTAPATAPPVADFTVTCTQLSCSADGRASTDPDGTVVSYSWDWGDGTRTNGSLGSHSYLAAGHFVVRLTVTDNAGATGNITHTVDPTVPVNQPPTAIAAGSCTSLSCSVSGAGSSDPDGTITGYSWAWADGTPAGAGSTTGHIYGSAGPRTVTLTVTDNQGATATALLPLSPTAPTNVPFAADSFARTLATGWGTADTGGPWTVAGAVTKYAVRSGGGTMTAAVGQTDSAVLQGVSSADTDMRVTLASDRLATGNGTYITMIGRRVGTNLEYQARLRTLTNGSFALMLGMFNGSSTTTVLKPEVVPTGVSFAAGAAVTVRFQVSGTSPTTVRVKTWKAGTTEPTAWQLTTTDAVAALQAPGSVGVQSYLSSSSTVTPVTVTMSDFSARPVTGN